MKTIEEVSLDYRKQIEAYLESIYAPYSQEPQKLIFEAANYSLLAGGKRLRPIFTLDFCKMCGGDPQDALPLAAAAEMIHTYSLIHDDLPCMDNDDYRRGRLTNHKVYGEGMAVLAGDALLTDAFAVATRANLREQKQLAMAIGVLSECAGSLGMIGGQVLDIQSRKTGALIRCACALGVIAGNGNEEQMQSAVNFAALLGLAFQIRDDILDVIGDAAELGKATGVDTGKNTFVRLYGVDKCEELVKEYTRKALECLDGFSDTQYMRSLAISLTERRN